MTVDRSGMPRGLGAVAASVLLTAILTLAACSSSNRGVTGSVGVGNGVALITTGDITQLIVGQSLVVSAAVTNDVNNEGVTWKIQQSSGLSNGTPLPQGTLSNKTTTSVIFTAPTTTFKGETSATITATSNANQAYFSQVTIVTLGTEQFDTATLFPANVNVPYAASFSVSGGTQPFVWTLASDSPGPIPPGLVLNGSTTGLNSISGTPTAAGTYTFKIQAEDATSIPIAQTVTLAVNAQSTCILTPGSYALMASGFRGGGGMTHVANIVIDAAGVISGEQDYKDGHRTTTDEHLISTSLCTNRQTNSGQIALNAPSGGLLYNMSVTPPDANGVIQSARLQLIGSGSDTASGLLQRVDPTTIGTSAPAGNFAFGQFGLTREEPSSAHFASAGRFTSDASGTLTNGLIDSNAAPALSNAPLSGTLSAPDALGRGTATLSVVGGQTQTFAYYFVTPNKYYLMNIDPQNGASTSPRSSGFMTMQVGNVGGTSFDNTAFGTASAPSTSVLSLWGAVVGLEPITVQALGLLSGSTPASAGGTSTLNGLIDISDQETDLAAQAFNNQPFAVDTNGFGRGELTLNNGSSSYSLVFYLDGIGNGYVVQTNNTSGAGTGGLLEAQSAMPVGGFPVTLPGFFVGGTQFAMDAGPITLNPLASLNFGTLSSNFTNALFYIDQTTGRGLGTLTQTGVGTQPAAMYYVSPTKFEMLRFSTRAFNGNIDWYIQD